MLAGRLLGNGGWVQLSRAEEPEDTHWTVTVVGTDLSTCGVHIVLGGIG